MAYERRDISGAAPPTTLAASLTAGDTSASLTSGTNWPTGSVGKFTVRINPGGANEEKCLATTRTGNSVTGLTRGYDGTTAQAHSAGETIEVVFSAVEADEANYAVTQTVAKVTTAGDLLVASAANTFARHPVTATTGYLLQEDTAQPNKMKWAPLPTGAVSASAMVGASVIGATQIATDAVTTAKILDGAVTSAKILDGTIVAGDLATDSVTTVKILDANVTTAKIADDAVTYAKVQNVSATDRLLGRDTAAAGDIEEIAVAGEIEFSGSGSIRLRATPSASVFRSGTQSIASATWTQVAFTNEDYDPLNIRGVGNDFLTVPVGFDGKYLIIVHTEVTFDTSITEVGVGFEKHASTVQDGSQPTYRQKLTGLSSPNRNPNPSFSRVLSLIAGDNISMWIWQVSSGARTHENPRIQVEYLKP